MSTPPRGSRVADDRAQIRGDHHRRQRPLGAAARPAGRSRGTGPAPTWSRRGCATPSSWGSSELTVFSFSTENWTRPAEEVAGLMEMFGERIAARDARAGRRGGADALRRPPRGGRRRAWSSGWSGPRRRPRATTGSTLFVAFNYGGRAEIVDAARSFQGGSEEEFRRHLYAPEMHDPDLLIRTSGEQRISNYLLWQCAYSELRLPRRALAGLRPRRLRGLVARVRDASAPLRSEIVTVDLFDDEMFEDEPAPPPRPPRPPRRKRGARGETAKRVLVALPWIVFAIAITVAGGIVFALAMIAIGIVCLREYVRDDGRLAAAPDPRLHRRRRAGPRRPLRHRLQRSDDPRRQLPAAVRLRRQRASHRDGVTVSLGVTLLGILWIGIPLAHAVLLRDLPSHGAGAAGRRPGRDLRRRHRRLRHRPHVRQPQDRPQHLARTRRSRG